MPNCLTHARPAVPHRHSHSPPTPAYAVWCGVRKTGGRGHALWVVDMRCRRAESWTREVAAAPGENSALPRYQVNGLKAVSVIRNLFARELWGARGVLGRNVAR